MWSLGHFVMTFIVIDQSKPSSAHTGVGSSYPYNYIHYYIIQSAVVILFTELKPFVKIF